MIRAAEQCACPIVEVGPSMGASCGGQVLLFMTLLETFINGRCDLADPCNRVHNKEDLDDNYDFVVVGGGTAGSVIAARLSENPQWKVLLIEAGGDEPVPSSVPALLTAYWGREDTDWNCHTEAQEKACLNSGGKCSWPRAKMLGGCSVINGMMYMRGQPADYDAWAVNGATGWSWYDVLPYFLKSEDNKEIGKRVSGQYHNTGGPLPVQKFRHAPQFAHDVVSAAIELGYPPTSDLNGDSITGFTIAQTLNDGGSRFSTARAFLRPASKRENLHILLHAHGSRVIIDPVLKKVTGVEYIKNGQTKRVGVIKEAILSSGSLNSPQLLMLSGVGPKQTLDKFNIPVLKDLPGVGQNLHNHVGVNLEFKLTKEPEIPTLNWASAMEYLLNRDGPLSSTGLSQLTGKINSKYAAAGGRNPDLQFFFSGYFAGCGDQKVLENDQVAEIKEKRDVSISVVALQPRSRGYLTLQSIDPFQQPLMQPNYFLDEHELNVIVDGARTAYRLANTTIMREKYGMMPSEGYGKECGEGGLNPSDEFFKCLTIHHTAPENHQAGTCKMGPESDPMAVVDMELKVYGIKGLRVADASIMPTVPSGNTAVPVIMIAERAAEMIMTRYQRSRTPPNVITRLGPNEDTGSGYETTGSRRWSDEQQPTSFEGKDDKLKDNQQKPGHWDGSRWRPWDKTWQNQWGSWGKPHYHYNENWQYNDVTTKQYASR